MASTNPRDSNNNNNNIQPTATDHRPRSHPILQSRRTSYCSTMHGHGLGLDRTTAVAPSALHHQHHHHRAPPPPGTTTTAHPGSPVSLCFKLGRRPNPPSVLFLSSFFFVPHSRLCSDSRLSPDQADLGCRLQSVCMNWLCFCSKVHHISESWLACC